MNWATKLAEHYRSKDNIANIFGIILYLDANPHIKKVLLDKDYWSALNEISGPIWAIFSIKPETGRFGQRGPSGETIGFLVPVWKEPAANKPIIDEFELGSTKDLPLLLIFTHDDEENILKLTIKLDDESTQSSYNSLKNAIQTVADAVEGVLPEYRKSPYGVFNAVKMRVDYYNQMQVIKKGVNFYSWIKGLLFFLA